MRTTLTLEPDVAAKLKAKLRDGHAKTFKDALNETLRSGFIYEEQSKAKAKKPFKIIGRDLKPRRNFNFDCISRLLEEIEGPDFK